MEISQLEMAQLCSAINKVSSYDFSNYSYKSFYRRIEKILVDNNITIPTLIEKIYLDYNYLESIVREITVNTTEFFRDPIVWKNLYNYLPQHFLENNSLKIWHAGCSNGLEVYSMLVLLNELNLLDITSIYGSDINEEVLFTAQNGCYNYFDIQEYFPNFDKVFNENKDYTDEKYLNLEKYITISVNKDIVKMKHFLVEKPIFVKHNLISQENIFNTKFDIIMCRNLLIYFNRDLQLQILDFFYSMLETGGILVVGCQESLYGQVADKFIKHDTIYIKK
ncbi:MAG: hypothetical protein MJ211_10625 [Bacteroidales bacterium]|nr:hypothetical protein [Bacteroidales bacterium]